MILFDLKCEKNHTFEVWFASNSDYETQLKKMIECPYCNSTKIHKDLMAPNINTKGISKKIKTAQRNLENQIKKFKKYIENNTDNVGKNFAAEARKIYYGETNLGLLEEKLEKETKELKEEGIPFSQLPWQTKEDA